MKKVFLLLAFAFCATVAFASKTNPTISMTGESDMNSPKDVMLSSPDGICTLCTACYTSQTYICASGATCEIAATNLAFAFEALHCLGESDD